MANGFDDELAMSAADVLAEQRRLEEEAIRLELPKQEAEARLLGAGSRIAPVEPGQYEFGSVMPTSSGFMYVGNPIGEPLDPAGAARRVAEATRPDYPTLASVRADPRTAGYDPEMQRFAARLNIEEAIRRGVPPKEAIALHGQDFFQAPTGGLTENQAANLALNQQRLALSREKFAEAQRRATEPPQYQTVTDIIPAVEAVPAIPATPGKVRSRFGLDFLAKDIPPTPEIPGTPGTPAQRITRRVPIEPPSPETPQRITSKAQFDALPKGAVYIGRDGKRYRKP